MKKRFFGTLLTGALLVASMSTFVSCKDYDDDISKHTTDITNLQTQLNALQTELATTKAEATAAKTEAANAKSEAANALAAAKTETANNLEKAIEDLQAVINGKVSQADYEAKIKEIQDQIAAIDVNLLTPEWKADVEARLNTLEGAMAICQKQLESQRNVLNALIESLLTDDAAKARLVKAAEAIDANGDIDEATLEALKKKMQTVSDVVDEIAPDGNIITLFADRSLKSLVFKPATYYWGIEASVIQRLTLKPYIKTGEWGYKELIDYIDKDTKREEVVGDPDWRLSVKEKTSNYAHVNVNRDDEHDRYSTGKEFSVMFDAVAEYHINPTSAKIPETSTINIISNNTSYTRAKGNAVVSLLGEASKKDGLWSVDRGILSVPLDVQGTVSTVVDSIIDNAKSYVTMFATQVSTVDTTVTSDYACIVEEKVKDIRLSHVPYVKTASLRKEDVDFIQTGLLNEHCGQCAYYKLIGKPMGMHLFATVGEAKDFVVRSHTGQDLVNYQQDINLSALIETHYTNSNDEHMIFSGSVFNRNFEYKFELTDFRITAGNNTNESAHAAIYKDIDGNYMLHPQDPMAGGLDGKPYNAAKATEVVIDRVPLVRVSLIYKATGDVVEYGYLPIKITGSNPVKKDYAHATYTSKNDSKITRYNECYTEGGSDINVITTDWRQTEEDLMSHKVFTEGELKRALSREEFENNYDAETAAPNYLLEELQQYYLTNEAAYLADPENVNPVFAKVDDSAGANYKLRTVGKIAYVEGAIGTGGLGTSILTWTMADTEVKAVCEKSWSPVVRAIKLESKDTGTYPDLYVVFVSGKFEIDNKIVEADMKITAHRINEYWYTAGNAPFQQGDVEIHTNVITPEEADQSKMGDPAFDGWKPLVFENQLRYVFEKNFGDGDFTTWMTFSGQSASASQPFKSTNVKLGVFFDDSANGIYKGYTEAGAAKEFYVKNMNGTLTTATDKSKKNLYARLNTALDVPASYQLVATIFDNGWDGTTADAGKLKQLKVSLNNDVYAKALLNYVDHELVGEPYVLKATVAVVPKDQKASATDVPYTILTKKVDGVDKEYINYAVENGTDYCLLYLTNYKFDVRFLRPISIANLDDNIIEDATAGVDVPQIIKLSELIKGYTDFRGSITAPNWKPNATSNLNYEEYYSPLGTNKFVVHVQNLSAGDYLSNNANVLTNLNQSDPNTFVSLKSVSSDIIFQMKTDDEIEYRNAGSTVQEFKIKIPVQVDYFWGTVYDNVTVTIKKTKANARRK